MGTPIPDDSFRRKESVENPLKIRKTMNRRVFSSGIVRAVSVQSAAVDRVWFPGCFPLHDSGRVLRLTAGGSRLIRSVGKEARTEDREAEQAGLQRSGVELYPRDMGADKPKGTAKK